MMGGEGTPRSDLGPILFGAIVRGIFFALAIAALIVVAHFSGLIFDKEPTAAEKFGCAKTYINARGEDTGECQ